MGVYKGIAQDNVTINSGRATLQTLTVTGVLTASGGVAGTVTGPVRLPVTTVAALGSTQANAAALAEGLNVVSAADGTKGVRLPTAVPGAVVIVKNTAAAALKIYPATGGAINAISADGAYSITNVTSTLLVASSATQWYSVPLVAS
jgi:uncharacterized membrane protein